MVNESDSNSPGGTNEAKIRAEVEETANELTAQVKKKDDQPREETKPEFTFEQLKAAYYQNEYGDADITISYFMGKLLRDNNAEKFYIFKDHIWRKCKNREQEALFREIADIYGREAANCSKRAEDMSVEMDKTIEECKKEAKKTDDENIKAVISELNWQRKFNDRANNLRGNARMKNVLNLATAGNNSLGVDGEGWNLEPTLLPVANGVVDLETGTLRDGRYDDWFSVGSPVHYSGLHIETKFVDDLIGKLLRYNDEVINYFEYFVGACTTGIQTKNFFVAYGPLGDNGKSLYFDWMNDVLGGFSATIPVEMIYDDRFGRDPDKPSPTTLKLKGLRMAIMSEAQRNKQLSLSKVKTFTSGKDKMSARNLNIGDIIDFDPTHTTLMHSNEMPKVWGNSEAFYNRLQPIPFRAHFVKNDKDVDEANHIYKQIPRFQMDKLVKEHDTELLTYLVRCARKFLKKGDMPEPPEEVENEKKNIRRDYDVLGRFLEDCTEKNKLWKMQSKDFYRAFRYHCIEELGYSPKQVPSLKSIAPDIHNLPYIEYIPGRVVQYQGIKLVDDAIPPADFK